MAIDYKALFSSNHFTRSQYDILRRLVELAVAEGGGEGGVPDNNKADKVTLMIAGTGLSGGGDLSTNRTFTLDLSYTDARYPLIVDGKINVSVIPALPGRDTHVAASEAAMLALSAAKGDFCVRSDVPKTFVLAALPASTLANWIELPSTSAVSSAFGRTGAVVAATNDYTFAQIGSKPTTLGGYGITDAEPTIAAATPDPATKYYRGDKTWQVLTKTSVGLSNVDNTADNDKPLGTTQLATLSASTGGTLLGTIPPGTGAIARNLQTALHEGAISLRSFALADGSDDTTRITNWLTALETNNRRGYVPAGDYSTDSVSFTTDNIDIEMHPLARFVGRSINILGSELSSAANSGAWTLNLNGGGAGSVTQDANGIHFIDADNLAAASFGVTLEDDVQYEVAYTLANRTEGSVRVLLYGPTNNHLGSTPSHSVNGNIVERTVTNGTTTAFTNQIRIQATGGTAANTYDITAISVKKVLGGSAGPIFTFTSETGTTTAPTGVVRITGGQFNTAVRAFTNEGDAIAVKCVNYAMVQVRDTQFIGEVDHETGLVNDMGGTGLRIESSNAITVHGCRFVGHQDAGLAIVGANNAALTDDGFGANIVGNHFVKCYRGWKATRQSRNVNASGNEYLQCEIGASAHDANSISAARVSIKGEMFLKCGGAAIDLKQQNGAVIANNTIIDLGYKIDGTTAVTGTRAAIKLGACVSTLVTGNVIRMDQFTPQADSFGVRNEAYSAVNPSKNVISNNTLQGLGSGMYDDGLGTGMIYRGNEFSDITIANHDTVPAAFLPYGVYTPVTTNVTNTAASSANTSAWRRVERDITVSVYLLIDPTAAGAGEIEVTLPVDPGANFGSDQDLLGVASTGTTASGAHGHFIAKNGAKAARLLYVVPSGDIAQHSWIGSFTYRIAGDSVALPPPASGNYVTDEAGNRLTDESANLLTL